MRVNRSGAVAAAGDGRRYPSRPQEPAILPFVMRKTFRPPVKARRERRWLVRRERDDELSEQDAILDLGRADKQGASGDAST